MNWFDLTTNDGKYLVQSSNEELKKRMYEYIRAGLAEGMPLSSIVFTWKPTRPDRLPRNPR